MKRAEKLKLLFKHPFQIINLGLPGYKEELYRLKIRHTYKIEQLPTIDLCDLFPGFSESLSCYTFLDGTSLVPDIMLLKSLARSFKDCAYLEIGSWRGESLANVYEVTKDCTSITLAEDEMRGMNLSEDFIKVHGIFSKNMKNLKTIKHNSQTYDFDQLNKKFDLIFIDGDHSYEGVLTDTINSFKIRKGRSSIIAWHDYGNSPEKVRHSVLAAILDGVPVEFHKNLYHVSNTLCAVYIENMKFDTSFTKFPTYPNKVFSIRVSAEKI